MQVSSAQRGPTLNAPNGSTLTMWSQQDSSNEYVVHVREAPCHSPHHTAMDSCRPLHKSHRQNG